jgi:hypothetical protein
MAADFPQTAITAIEQFSAFCHERRVQHFPRKEWVAQRLRAKPLILDKLGESWVAQQVALGFQMQHLGIDLADHVFKVKFTVGDGFDLFTADSA